MKKYIYLLLLLFVGVFGFANAQSTITRTFKSVPYKNGTFLTKTQACRLGNIVNLSGIQFTYNFPSNSTDQRGYIDGFAKQNNILFYLTRVEYYVNKKHIVEHQLFSYNCITKKPASVGTGIAFTGVMQFPGDSNLFVRYVDTSSKTALFELGYEGPAQYYLVNLVSGKIQNFNPKVFKGRDKINKSILQIIKNAGDKVQNDTLDPTCINCGGYESQTVFMIGNSFSAPNGKLSSVIKVFSNGNRDRPYASVPVFIDMKRKTIGVR